MQRRGRGRHRLPRIAQGDRLPAGKPDPLRHQGRDLPGPHRRHEPVEVGATRSRPRRARWPRRFEGADVAFGLSVKGAFTAGDGQVDGGQADHLRAWPIPIRKSPPRKWREVRDDAIMATGRSDYPNQVNNVLGFPYIFRGALDVRASTINMEMKIAAAHALAELAREDVPDEVAAAYGARPKFGPDYIIPVPFDPRLISYVPPAVAKAAMDTGVARKPIVDMDAYRQQLQRAARSDRRDVWCRCSRGCGGQPKRVVFAEGEEEQVIRAAASFVRSGARHRASGRARGPRAAGRARGRHRARRRHRDRQRAAVDPQYRLHQLSLRAAAAARLSAARLPAAGEHGPQSFRRLHGGARRRRRHGDRRHPQFLGRARGRAPRDRSQARPPRDRRVAGGGARPHRAGGRHRGDRNAGRARDSPRSPSRRPASRAGSATSRGWRCWPSPPSAIRRASARRG